MLNQTDLSIVKKFRKPIWNNMIGALKDYSMIQENDRIGVCISGGKDSMLLAKCMQRLCKYSNFPFSVEYIVMDPGYAPENRQKIIDNAELLDIPIVIFESNIFKITEKTEKSPCYLCAKMRRGHLYAKARELGCNKIALGHHFDDVIETTLLSIMYGGEMKTMLPRLRSQNFEGMELIRPLYTVKEASIIAWARYNSLSFINCACRITRNENASKRKEIKELIAHLRTVHKGIDDNIFRSAQNVNLNVLLGYLQGDEKHSFLENFNL